VGPVVEPVSKFDLCGCSKNSVFGTVSLDFEIVFVVCRIFSANVTNGEIRFFR
jgi:hypothetical protein